MVDNVEKFAKVLEKGKPEGYLGVAYGKVIEKIVKHGDIGKDDAEESSAVVLLIGYVMQSHYMSQEHVTELYNSWESKALHLKFRDTTLFKDNISLLREKNGGAEVVSSVYFKGMR